MSTSSVTAAVHSFPSPCRFQQVDDLLKLQKLPRRSVDPRPRRTVDKVVNDVARSFGCVDADIYLHNEERGELVLTRACGCEGCTAHGPGHSLKIGKEGMVGHVAATGQMRYAPDVRKDPYYIGCEEATRSEVAIPLHVEGQLVGVFSTSHHELDAFRPEQLRLLQALCNDVAIAVHNARRFRQEQHQRRADEPRGAGSPHHSAGAAAQEFALHSGVCRVRIFHFCRGGGRRLVRLYSHGRRAAGRWCSPMSRVKAQRRLC